MITALDWMKSLHAICQFQSIETPNKIASGSELRRWIEQNAVIVNGEKLSPKETMDFPIISVVLFPKSEIRRTTIW